MVNVIYFDTRFNHLEHHLSTNVIPRHPKYLYKISPTTGKRLPSKQALKKRLQKIDAQRLHILTLLAEHDLPLEGQL